MMFFPLWSTKEDILKNIDNQTVLVTTDFRFMDKNLVENTLCSTEERTGLERQVWINDDII